jgi:CheY-like chemotaxis protein/Tfp pilus assembly protein PilZ
LDQSFRRTIVLSADLHRALTREDCYLQRPAFQLHAGRTGGEIVELSRRAAPDAVLIEFGLPDQGADAVCRVLKDSAAPPPVLIVGPARPPSVRQGCLDAGCDEYIETPAPANLVLSRLAPFLGIQFRLHARLPTVVSISSGRIISEFLGYTRDISEGGLLVEATMRMEQGRRLFLRLYLEDQDRPLRAPATVLRVEPVPDEERFLIGLQFNALEPTAAERLKSFIRNRSSGH